MPGAVSDNSKLTVEQLRQKLKEQNKDATGKKEVLLARLEGKSEYETLTVVELRKKLKQEGKDSTGNKAELIARLTFSSDVASSVEQVEQSSKKRKVDPEEMEEKKGKKATKEKKAKVEAAEEKEDKVADKEEKKDENEEAVDPRVEELCKKIKLVRHSTSVVGIKSAKGFVEAYRKQVKKMLAITFASGSIDMFTPRTNQFTLTTLECEGLEYKVLLERCHDHPAGAVWYSPDPESPEWDWFGEATLGGWIGGREDAPDTTNDTMMAAFEKWFYADENQGKIKHVFKEPKYNPYYGYGRAS